MGGNSTCNEAVGSSPQIPEQDSMCVHAGICLCVSAHKCEFVCTCESPFGCVSTLRGDWQPRKSMT